jgi:phage-related protein
MIDPLDEAAVDAIITVDDVQGPVTALESTADEMVAKTADACDIGGTFKGSFPSFPDFNGPDIGGITDGIEDAIGDVTKKIGEATKAIKTAISEAIGDIKEFVDLVRARAGEFLTAIRNAVGPLLIEIQAAFDNFKGLISTAKTAVTDAIGAVTAELQEQVALVGEKITTMLGNLVKVASSAKIEGCVIASSAVGFLGKGVSAALDLVNDGIESGVGAVSGLINDQASKLTAVTDGLATDAAAFASFDSATSALGIKDEFTTFTNVLNIQVPTV